MKIWKNTATLDGFDLGLNFTTKKYDADIVLMGSKPIKIQEFPNLRGIFRAGVGKENVPREEARSRNIVVKFPSQKTIEIIYDETANFTCGLIFRMIYNSVGSLKPWLKNPREQLNLKKLLIIGGGKIGNRVEVLMSPFMKVQVFDILNNNFYDLKEMIQKADCISLHIPKNKANIAFIDDEKLSWMKNGSILINTSRGAIVDEIALLKEISDNRISAAFDVFWDEPYLGDLKEFYPDYFFMTPHVASTCIGFLKGCREDLDNLILKLSNNN